MWLVRPDLRWEKYLVPRDKAVNVLLQQRSWQYFQPELSRLQLLIIDKEQILSEHLRKHEKYHC